MKTGQENGGLLIQMPA